MTAQKVAALDACLNNGLTKINAVLGKMNDLQNQMLIMMFEADACCPVTLAREHSPSGAYCRDTVIFHTEHGDFKYSVTTPIFDFSNADKIPQMVVWFSQCLK